MSSGSQIFQEIHEPITNYYSKKLEAYHGAVLNPTHESYIYFKNQTIRGIYAPIIRQKVIEANPDNYERLIESMLKSVAKALECFKMDTGLVTNLDGLAATTAANPGSWEEPMDLSSIHKIICYNYGQEGHISAKCLRKAPNQYN